jgi:hypothetical protein
MLEGRVNFVELYRGRKTNKRDIRNAGMSCLERQLLEVALE